MSLLSRLRRKSSTAACVGVAIGSGADSQELKAAFDEAHRQFQTGDLEAARTSFMRIVELDPLHAQAHYMLSVIAMQQGDAESAIGLAQKAIALEPADADFHSGLADAYASRGRLPEAIRAYQEAIRLKPDLPERRLALAATLIRAGRLNEAVAVHEAGRTAGLPDARAYFDLGDALLRCRHLYEAEQALQQAAAMAPESAGIQFYLAIARREQDRLVDAEAAARSAVAVAPDMPQGWFALGSVLTGQAKPVEAVEYYRKAISLMPDYEAAWDGLLFSMNYSDHWSPREIYAAHVEWGRRFPRVEPMRVASSHRAAGHRVRVGYLSADYRQHPVSHFIEPVLRHHDRDRFEVFCYHTDPREDSVTRRLKRWGDNWRSLGSASDPDLERVLREDGLDILVELSGHSDGHRLGVLARRVAPVQVTYLGYPNTTGLPAIDYRLTDARADPPGESDELHVEKLVRLPKTFLCYAPPEAGESCRTAPFRRNGYVTFASFNNFRKISPTCIALWGRVLSSVPGSKLLLKTFGLQDPALRASLLKRLEMAGVGADRVSIAEPLRSLRDHMQAYDEVDIALDTFPYHGTTTTLDALWMGVPVITLAGDRHASRVGVSILSALGLTECLVRTPDQYLAVVHELAADAGKLEQYRTALRERLAGSPLSDGRDFTAKLEDAYLEMWKQVGWRN
jgi:predicted O-linked N-acetylglucosamine transferase (SPINDLY family)